MNIGNVEKRGENRYRLTVSGGFDSNGKRIKYRRNVIAKSDREAQKQLAMFVSEIERGEYVNTQKMTYKELAEKWWNDYAVLNLEAKTLARYEELLKYTIYPAIGDLRLEQIKPLHLLDLYTSLTKDGARRDGKSGGYSAKTIQHVHRLIRTIFEKGVLWQLLTTNPAGNIKPPKAVKTEISFYDEENLLKLLAALDKENLRYKTIVLMALNTGMRRGEIAALCWKDVDFDKNIIKIDKAVVYVPKKGRIVKGTKTVRSQRILYMTEALSNALKEYRAWQEENKSLVNTWQNTDNVFTNDFGNPIHPDTITAWFVKFIRKNNLPHITFHGLRHTSATLMLSAGVDIETVSRILGHSTSITTSGVYLHSAQVAREEAMNKLSDKLSQCNKKITN